MEPHHIHNISEISAETLTNPEFTPDKLSIMKLRNADFLQSRDYLSAPTTPTGARKTFDFSSALDGGRSSSMARTSRQVSSSTRRSGSFRQSHGGLKVSMELTRQAEGKFFALMDLVSSASREASSLKEVWSALISERESLTREREDLLEAISEVTETLERKENEQSHHGHEHEQRKKQVEKLLVELSVALNTVSDHERRSKSREHELLHARNELQNLRDSVSRSTIAHNRLKSDFSASELRIKAAEDERDHAKRNADQYQEEVRSLTREHTELKSKSIEITSRLETTRKEVLSFTDRLKIAEMDRDNYSIEKDRLHELLRKANLKNEETSMELLELTERHEHHLRDINKHKETIRELESDVDKFSNTADHLRREIKTKTVQFDEAEARATEINLKFEHLKREHSMNKDRLSTLELERSEQQEIIDRIREESRVALLEKNTVRDELEMWRHRAGNHQRLINQLQETLRKTELTLVEVRSEVHTLTDRLSHAERERDDAHGKHGHHTGEISSLKEKLVILQAELRSLHESRDRLQNELQESRRQYEEVTETMTEFRDSSGGYEFEIEHLRTMLRESREQKERAITARNAADRERDEYISRYEEKCREMERFEQSASSCFHSSIGSGGKHSSSRVVSRTNTVNTSGTAVHNSSSNGHSHGLGHSSEFHSGGEQQSGSME